MSALTGLVCRHAAHENASAPPPDIGARIGDLVRAGEMWCWVAELPENVVVGYATTTEDVATFTGSRFGHLDCLFLDEHRRGTGIGRVLMDTVLAWSVRRGHRELQWQSPEWNVDAHRFYARFGPVQKTKRRFVLGHSPTSPVDET